MPSEESYIASAADELGVAHHAFVETIAAHLAKGREEATGSGTASQTRRCRQQTFSRPLTAGMRSRRCRIQRRSERTKTVSCPPTLAAGTIGTPDRSPGVQTCAPAPDSLITVCASWHRIDLGPRPDDHVTPSAERRANALAGVGDHATRRK